MTTNFTADGEPIVTEAALEALKSFVAETDISRLIIGTAKVLLNHFRTEVGRELYMNDHLHDSENLIDLLAVLVGEYEVVTRLR
jgi:hypothetical protein